MKRERTRSKEKVDIDFTLRRVFGKKSFRSESRLLGPSGILKLMNLTRPLQREIISATIDGHDVFVQAATSFGKSLCFQLPAVIGIGSMLYLDGQP
jgi:hypothetical protein